jgi:hypothetical protein
MLIRRR